MPGKTGRTGYINVRSSETARWILDTLTELLGLSQSSVLELLLREEARRRGITVPGSGADLARRQEEREAIGGHLASLMEKLGLNEKSVLEILVKEEAKKRGIPIPISGSDQARRKEERDALGDQIARHQEALGGPKKP
jgi:hypothetical protein